MTQYLVSIDLGTTNSVLAYAAPGGAVQLFEVEQLTAPGEVGGAKLLPSSRYHPAQGEIAAGDLALPWAEPVLDGVPAGAVIGRLARQLGGQVPGRLVSSAKSWLSHTGVDRMAPILPWGAADDVARVSPVAASASYLAHLRAAWNTRFPAAPLERQQLVLTIPASFDEGARALTLEAARMAGLPSLRLLEEPQAALYDWLYRQRDALAQELAGARLVLVADVGGGTTDFTLVKVEMVDGAPQLTRIGVGNHLILGGDNMDLALAHLAEQRLAGSEADGAPAQRLSAARLAQLTERCRAAKESLLAQDAPEQVSVTLLGAGSRLVGGSRSVTLTRADVERIVLDGFFPLNETQQAAHSKRGGIVEFGLPYASDPAVTRHLASFLRQHGAAARAALGLADDGRLPVPDTLLLNGGVFRAAKLAERLAATLGAWRGQPVRVLHNDDPDVAVARGGVAYALGKQGLAPTIAGGSPRSYWLLLDNARAPGVTRRAVCLLPRGSASGQEVRLTERSFALRLGRPVRFHIATTLADATPPQAGDVADLPPDELTALPAIATVLRDRSDAGARKEITVQLAASLTEVGTLEVHCEADGQRWQLEFQLREHGDAAGSDGDDGAAEAANEPALPARLPEALEKIDRIFGSRAQQVDVKEVRQLRSQLEHLLTSRERWTTPLLRRLFDALMERAKGRRRSPEHERTWLNLAGYCLRPGFGHALDEWRIEQLWALFESGVQNHKDSQVCAEWWTLWRRVSGGLPPAAQLRLLDDFAFNLQADASERGRRPVTLVNGSEEDMLRLGASLERIPSAYKAEIGNWMVGELPKAKNLATQTRYLWALGRVGARRPFHGSAHDVAPVETVEQWLQAILQLDWRKVEPAGFAAAHLARMTGDRSRDIGDALRAEVVRRLESAGAPPSWPAMVRDVVQLDQASEQRLLGEALPPGLKLLS
ncbi:Hsp70 family protein [Pseudoduganella sp.]|uniref:Hsp70 family protein n=1 Tax=Pseudoduganella sp. TaxID=1880898 RepID=UPI0035AE445F